MRSALAITAVVALCSLLVAPASPAVGAKEEWVKVSSRNFTFIGNARQRDIQRVATRLEQFRDVFSRSFNGNMFDSSGPVTVIVFKSDAAYAPFKPLYQGRAMDDVAGYFQPGADMNYITLAAETRDASPYVTIFHEYVHFLVNNSIRNVPLWLNEGLAKYYETLELSDDGRRVLLGRSNERRILSLRQRGLLPLRTLFAVDYGSPYYGERERRSLFYAESWALVHYLLQGDGGRRAPQFSRLIELLATGASFEEAFGQAFQADFEAIERELKEYIWRGTFPVRVVTLGDERSDLNVETRAGPITEAEALGHLGDLLRHTNRPDDAEIYLQKALALDPDLALAHTSLGVLRVRQNRLSDAKPHFERAIAANSQNHLAHYYYAYALSREGMIDGYGTVAGYEPERAEIMRAALKKAMELAPQFYESHYLFAFINLVRDEQLDESIALLERALRDSPGQQKLAIVLGQIYSRKREFGAARKILGPLVHGGADAPLRARAESLLQRIASLEESGNGPAGAETARKEMSSTEDGAESPRWTMRRRFDGEQVRGLLLSVECADKGVMIFVKVGEQTLKLRGETLKSIQFVTYTREVRGPITCGPRNPANPALVTYRPSADLNTKISGEAIAVEFVPQDFTIEILPRRN